MLSFALLLPTSVNGPSQAALPLPDSLEISVGGDQGSGSPRPGTQRSQPSPVDMEWSRGQPQSESSEFGLEDYAVKENTDA